MRDYPPPYWIPLVTATAAIAGFYYDLSLVVLGAALSASLQVGMSIWFIVKFVRQRGGK